jgi:hypothetical protein
MMDPKFPNEVQVCLLLANRKAVDIQSIAKDFLRIEEARFGHRYNMIELTSSFVRLFGTQEAMVTIEYMDTPANPAVFQATLASPFTRMSQPAAPEAVASHRSHILVNVSHGALGGGIEREFAGFFKEIGMQSPGYGMPKFRERLRIAALASSLSHDHAPAEMVHWVQSDTLWPGSVLEGFVKEEAPSIFHCHPNLFKGDDTWNGQQQVGFVTYGAAHFLGREIRVEPNPLPIPSSMQAAHVFLKVATMPNGYVIPDDDTFGDEDRSTSWRVRHIAEQNTGERSIPGYYSLQLQMARAINFETREFKALGPKIDLNNPPQELINTASPEGKDEVERLHARAKLSAGIGGQFEVRPKFGNQAGPPGKPVFGKRQ